MKVAQVKYYATGRRKTSVAKVWLSPGSGKIIVNDKNMEEYFPLETLRIIVKQPLTLTETLGKYDVIAKVQGGGLSGQAGAVRHGIARALVLADPTLRPALKKSWISYKRPAYGGEKEIRSQESKKSTPVLEKIKEFLQLLFSRSFYFCNLGVFLFHLLTIYTQKNIIKL